MLLIACPHCGERPEIEFRCGGEAHIARAPDPVAVDDAAWGEFLFYRTNLKGVHAERWLHAHGCGRWFNALRDTASDRILVTYAIGAPRPDVPSIGVPSHLVGEGQGGGESQRGWSPPTPSPSPQGGGESR
jgi:sarcosine oxidase subunit delta